MTEFMRVVLAILAAVALVGMGSSPLPSQGLDPKTTPVTPGELVILGEEGKPAGACPLKHTDVDAQVSGFIARVNVVQQFHNPTDEKIEAVYTFPLPDDSAVDRMEMKVGERTIVGEIHRREEAREIYEAAKEAGHVASLLDQERPNIFTQSVANIEPGEEVKITISYTQLLKYEAGEYEFSFPMVVGPRYIPGGTVVGKTGAGRAPDTDETPDASKITPPVAPKGTRAGHDISLKVRINAGIPLYSVKSLLHEADYNFLDGNSAEVTLKDQATIPNKDFVLKYAVAGEMVHSGVITHAAGDGSGFFTLIVQPPKQPKPKFVTPKEMIFVLDTSGSQSGEPIKKSKQTLWHCIKNLNPGDTFNLIAFSSSPRMLYDRAQPFNSKNEAAALKYIEACEAKCGTEVIPALKKALPIAPDPKRLRIVVFFSDGYVGNDMAIVDYCQKNLGAARVFTFGIGNGVNRFILSKMAEVGRGACDFVLLNSDGKQVAQRFYERLRNPILTDINIDWNGLPVVVEDIYPKRTPDLFSAQPLIVKGRYSAPAEGHIVVRGKVAGQPWEKQVYVNFPDEQPDNDSLASIWARAKVEDLMDQDWMGAQMNTPKPEIKESIIEVALDYHLMTQYTSFVAVEKMVITQGGKPTTIAVPVEMPEGVSYEKTLGLALRDKLKPGSGFGGYGGVARRGAALSSAVTPAPTESLSAMRADTKAAEVAFDLDSSVAVKGDEAKETPEMRRVRFVKQRLDKTLQELLEKYRKSGASGDYSIPGKLVVKDGKVEVMVWVKDGSKEKLAELEKLGLVDHAWARPGKILIGWIAISKLEDFAQAEFVARVSPPTYSK